MSLLLYLSILHLFCLLQLSVFCCVTPVNVLSVALVTTISVLLYISITYMLCLHQLSVFCCVTPANMLSVLLATTVSVMLCNTRQYSICSVCYNCQCSVALHLSTLDMFCLLQLSVFCCVTPVNILSLVFATTVSVFVVLPLSVFYLLCLLQLSVLCYNNNKLQMYT